jgi:hypothetical protein
MTKYRILSIDAWANCDNGCEHEEENGPACWDWNNWHHVGSTEQLPENVLEFVSILREGAPIDQLLKWLLGLIGLIAN